MRSREWALILIKIGNKVKKRRLSTDRYRRKTTGRSRKEGLPSTIYKNQPSDTLISDFWPPES